jgi:EAL domain-containing protein (putative c-di-GMP-specific phosphodiesterase class I)
VLQETAPFTSPPATLVRKINEALAETTYIGELGLATTASIGVVQSPPHRSDPVELMSAADMALRYAKQKGPGQWQLLHPDEDAADRRLHRLAAIMPGAWETGQLRVGYRLRVRLVDEQPVGVAAFARWQEAGLRGQSCVELGEETGLSPQLSGWLLSNAGEQLQKWHRRTGEELPLGMSLTPVQSSSPDLVPDLLEVLDELSLRPSLVQVALPAATVFGGRALSNLTELAEAGVETAIHDFGDVPSDVVRLADLPLQSVALTPRLVAQARGAAKTSLVAKALEGLVTFVHLAGAKVTIDEIQNRAEADWWRWAKADEASGAFYTPSLERGDIASLFR